MTQTAPPPNSGQLWLRRFRWGALALALIGLPLLVRSVAFHAALRGALESVRLLEGLIPTSRSHEESLEPVPLLEFGTEEEPPPPASDGSLAPAKESAAPGKEATHPTPVRGPSPRHALPKSPVLLEPPILPEPQSAYANERLVLAWVERRLMPRGILRDAFGDLPAGIELYDVEGLGLGLLDGDRLITVDGVPVRERSLVIRAVIEARARGARTMTAGLARRTQQGVKSFSVVIEQPYLDEEPGEAPSAAPGTGGHGASWGPPSDAKAIPLLPAEPTGPLLDGGVEPTPGGQDQGVKAPSPRAN